jgi:hypothetical protein
MARATLFRLPVPDHFLTRSRFTGSHTVKATLWCRAD